MYQCVVVLCSLTRSIKVAVILSSTTLQHNDHGAHYYTAIDGVRDTEQKMLL
jgi:ribosome-associated translation inhibitor RaiA